MEWIKPCFPKALYLRTIKKNNTQCMSPSIIFYKKPSKEIFKLFAPWVSLWRKLSMIQMIFPLLLKIWALKIMMSMFYPILSLSLNLIPLLCFSRDFNQVTWEEQSNFSNININWYWKQIMGQTATLNGFISL